MVLPNLSWKQNGYGNIVVIVASRSAVLVVMVCVCVLWGGGHDSSDGGGVMVLLCGWFGVEVKVVVMAKVHMGLDGNDSFS